MNNIVNFPTSPSGNHCPIFKQVAIVHIVSMTRQGRRYFSLDELYFTLAARTDAEKNGIQWAIAHAKEKGMITSTRERGFYKINRQP
jgi:hypothetical protein